MNIGKTLFAQFMEHVPWTSFHRIVDRYGGDDGVMRLSCADQFRAMGLRPASLWELEVAATENRRFTLKMP